MSHRLLNFELWFCLLPFAFCLFCAVPGLAKDQPLTDDEVVVRTEGAHRLILPRDWPVEHKDGRVSPVSIDQYLSMKFDQVKTVLSSTTQRLEALERRIDQLEQNERALLKRLRLLEERAAAQEVPHGETTQNP